MTETDGWPLRHEVEARWLAILDGSVTREEVHVWTVPWVEGEKDVGPADDTLVGMALQYLHGFTLAHGPEASNLLHHGPPGEYTKSLADVRSDLKYWRAECVDYDADPAAWRARRQAAATAAIEKEHHRD